MKKFTIIIVLLLGIFEFVFPHEQNVHQYIVREAYQLLRMQVDSFIDTKKLVLLR